MVRATAGETPGASTAVRLVLVMHRGKENCCETGPALTTKVECRVPVPAPG